jgi:1-phosphofructokinase
LNQRSSAYKEVVMRIAPSGRIVTVTPNPVLDRTLTVPELRLNAVLRASSTLLDAGGKGFNVSRGLHALGLASTAMGFVGGATGGLLESMLHALSIATDFVHCAGETRTNVVVTQPDGTHVKVNEAGPLISALELQNFYRLAEARARPGDLWALCGSLPRGLPDDFYAALIRILHHRGAQAVLDASGDALALGLAAGPFLVKPNQEEAAAATGLAVESVEDARRALEVLRGRGPQIVAVSLGAGGLLVGGPDGQVLHLRPPQVEAISAVGLGDSLVAGMIAALARGESLAGAARWGAACGTAKATLPGVEMPTAELVAQFAEQVQIARSQPIN